MTNYTSPLCCTLINSWSLSCIKIVMWAHHRGIQIHKYSESLQSTNCEVPPMGTTKASWSCTNSTEWHSILTILVRFRCAQKKLVMRLQQYACAKWQLASVETCIRKSGLDFGFVKSRAIQKPKPKFCHGLRLSMKPEIYLGCPLSVGQGIWNLKPEFCEISNPIFCCFEFQLGM